MIVDEVKKMIKQGGFDKKYPSVENPLFAGLKILDERGVLGWFWGFDHDQMYVSDFYNSVKSLTREDVERLICYGWFESDGYWSHFKWLPGR